LILGIVGNLGSLDNPKFIVDLRSDTVGNFGNLETTKSIVDFILGTEVGNFGNLETK